MVRSPTTAAALPRAAAPPAAPTPPTGSADGATDDAVADSTTADDPAFLLAPFASHERVEYYRQRFTGPMKGSFQVAMDRQARYSPMIRERLRAGGLPEDLIYLALIESWYDPHAVSVASAVGMWQFMSATAKAVGLRVDWWVDERRDPVRSTEAAVTFLRDLTDRFGSVYLASAAYNAGPGRVTRGLGAHAAALDGLSGDSLFFALRDGTSALPAETRDYVPKLIAATLVGRDAASYGIVPRATSAWAFDSVRIPANVPLAAVAKAAGAPLESLRELNPHLLRGMTPPTGGSLWVRIPPAAAAGFDSVFQGLPRAERTATERHTSRARETMASIAGRHGLTATQLASFNPGVRRLRSGRLAVGQRLLIPRADVASAARAVPDPARARTPSRRGATTYTVRRGDTLGEIAQRHGTTVAQLKRLNKMRSTTVRAGQRLRVR